MKNSLLRVLYLLAMVILLAIQPIGTLEAHAQEQPCIIGDRDQFVDYYRSGKFQNPDELTLGEDFTQLTVQYTDPSLTKIGKCPVRLRSYNGKLVGPTIRVKPDDTIKLQVNNTLPVPSPDEQDPKKYFNITNIHTHGLHVSPSGKADNVLREMQPKTINEVEIKLPSEHPGGTAWYHPHQHKSTALQVSSGMVGALIVKGELDEFLKTKGLNKDQDKIFLFQQIMYDNEGKLEDFNLVNDKNAWKKGKYPVMVNGQIAPTITMSTQEAQLWRFIHGGIRETINLQLQKIPAERNETVTNSEEFKALSSKSTNEVDLNEVAVDNINLGKVDKWNVIKLQPGYRSDVLVSIPDTGNYYLLDIPESEGLLTRGDATIPHKGQVLAYIEVVSTEPSDAPFLKSEIIGLLDQGDPAILANIKMDEAPDDVGIGTTEGEQTVAFGYNTDLREFTIDGKNFNHNNPSRCLQLNKKEAWTISSDTESGSHPFHIHVNPFQYERTGPRGTEETVWKDTVFVEDGKSLTMRTEYLDFTGEAVIHCHILNHEDTGMMQKIDITDDCSKPSPLAGS